MLTLLQQIQISKCVEGIEGTAKEIRSRCKSCTEQMTSLLAKAAADTGLEF